jgi:DNA-binding transcriptional MerR regulator
MALKGKPPEEHPEGRKRGSEGEQPEGRKRGSEGKLPEEGKRGSESKLPDERKKGSEGDFLGTASPDAVSSGMFSSDVASGFFPTSDASSEVPSGSPPPRPIARKEYYSISEVCELVDLRPHVLRYWETQFGLLNPSKNRSGNRVYQRKEIRLILLVKHLLYEEKYTVEGAKKKLEQLRKGGELQNATRGALDKQMVALLRAEMHTLVELLTPPQTPS